MKDYEKFDGPSPEEEEEARRRHHMRLMAESPANRGRQSNCSRWIGTPRKAKHRGQRFGGTKID